MIVRETRSLTLIEVCIAFGILAICFYVVFSNFNISSKLIARSEKASIISKQRQYLSERLYTVFEKTEPLSIQIEEKKDGAETIYFLSCVFENGLDREMTFSGTRRGEIELIDENLMLSIFSKDGLEVRKECLFSHVTHVDWELEPKSVVKLTLIDTQEKELSFAFILPRCDDDKLVFEEQS